jgi:hypothetical protein
MGSDRSAIETVRHRRCRGRQSLHSRGVSADAQRSVHHASGPPAGDPVASCMQRFRSYDPTRLGLQAPLSRQRRRASAGLAARWCAAPRRGATTWPSVILRQVQSRARKRRSDRSGPSRSFIITSVPSRSRPRGGAAEPARAPPLRPSSKRRALAVPIRCEAFWPGWCATSSG